MDGQIYFEVTNSSNVTQLSILLIIVGLFIMIVGAVGTVGAIFASNVFGRITLGLVSDVTEARCLNLTESDVSYLLMACCG